MLHITFTMMLIYEKTETKFLYLFNINFLPFFYIFKLQDLSILQKVVEQIFKLKNY